MVDLPYRIAESVGHRLVATAENRNLLAFEIERLKAVEKDSHIVLKIARAPGAGTKNQDIVVSDIGRS